MTSFFVDFDMTAADDPSSGADPERPGGWLRANRGRPGRRGDRRMGGR
jgi:hypothetical protein